MNTTPQNDAYYRSRGLAQPETPEEERRRLHREAAEAVKRYAAALREAKARYQDYDATMAEDATEAARAHEVPRAIGWA